MTMRKELPLEGGFTLRPVVQVTEVDDLLSIVQAIPSMVTSRVEAKLLPWIVIVVPPTLGPKAGVIDVTVDVEVALYCTKALLAVTVPAGKINLTSQSVIAEALTGKVLYICPTKLISASWHFEVEL